MNKLLDKVINKIAEISGADPITVMTRIFEGGFIAGAITFLILILKLFI